MRESCYDAVSDASDAVNELTSDMSGDSACAVHLRVSQHASQHADVCVLHLEHAVKVSFMFIGAVAGTVCPTFPGPDQG